MVVGVVSGFDAPMDVWVRSAMRVREILPWAGFPYGNADNLLRWFNIWLGGTINWERVGVLAFTGIDKALFYKAIKGKFLF